MSDEQQAPKQRIQVGTQDQKNQPDDREPNDERQAELREAYEVNLAAGRAPYQGVELRTRGELAWVSHERGWSGMIVGGGKDLPNLSGAYLGGANLSDADVTGANLSGAFLEGANLSGDDLRWANLSGTDLFGAILSGANMRKARLDAATVLRHSQLNTNTKLGDVVWNGAPLTQVDWANVPRLGDEQDIAKATGRKERIEALRDAARAYRGLSIALRGQGLLIPASRYRLREQRLERQASRLERHYGSWFFSLLLDAVAGYGERPGRIVGAYVTVVSVFAVAYGLVTHLVETKLSKLSWDESLVLSLTSFHGRGFFPGSLPLGDWVARIAAGEAVIGLFIELILIATFSKRFLGN